MGQVQAYALVAVSVFAVNLLPAFGPPTWAVLVLWYLHGGYAVALLVLVGAVSAAAGRLALAGATRRVGGHLPARQQANLKAASTRLLSRRRGALAGLGLFAMSPLPSAQLFEAAGLMDIPLVPMTAAFFAGRLVSYALYLGGAKAFRHTNAGELLLSSLTSPWAVVLEVVMLGGLVVLSQVNWGARWRRHNDTGLSETPGSPDSGDRS